ncbi:MAG: hypothetical protein WAT71_05670 [Ignavibacteria bacterium]
MKKYILLSSVIIIAAVSYSFRNRGDDPGKIKDGNNLPITVTSVDSKQMDANRIVTYYRNNGSFNRDPISGNAGFLWPKGETKFARYSSGMWIGAIVGNDTLMCIAEYDYEYLPGYVDNNGNPQGKDDPHYRIYKINKGDSLSNDYLNWPSDQGAYTDQNGKPVIIGDQTMFYSYTDGYPEAHNNNAGSTAPLKAQILQTNWAFKQKAGFLDDVIFTEYRIINRGDLPWTKCFISHWTDDDIGVATDDAVGCDTLLDLGFTYNFSGNDPNYGMAPPAVGFLYLRGGIIESQGDTLKYFSPPGSNNLILKPGYKFSGMSSFNMYTGGNPTVGDPSNYREAYLNMHGIRRNGTPWINPQTNQITKFAFSGDPASQTGWNETDQGDRRFMQTTGPLTVNPGDTQIVVVAQIIARGNSNLNSMIKLKQLTRSVKSFFNDNFDVSLTSPLPSVKNYSPGDGKIYLSWNDSCERVSFSNKLSGGTYKFQGYNIYRVKPNNYNPSSADTILLKTFDIIDGVKDIRDSVYLNDYEGIVYGIVQRGSDNGISRYIVLDKDTVSGESFISGTEYKFSVTGYYYDPIGGIYSLPKVYESPKYSNIIKVVPQILTPGTQVNYTYGDTVRTDQKDLAVMPIIIDPLILASASYTISFGLHDSVTVWNLSKTVNEVTSLIFQNEKDFFGQDTAKTYDGILFNNRFVKDSGIVRDPNISYNYSSNYKYPNTQKGWSYEPAENQWIQGPDTTAVITAKHITDRQFDSREIGMSFPTQNKFNNYRSKVQANKKFFTPVVGQNSILTGGPLRKIEIIFGQNSKSYRYTANNSPGDSLLTVGTFADMTEVPFSVFAVDELDSSGGTPRQLNTGFIDFDKDGSWDPDTTKLGNYHFTYIFASDYNPSAQTDYTDKNPLSGSPIFGFPTMDVMYAWLPRVKRSADGSPLTFTAGDKLTITPYRITRPDFVPGFPVKYSWEMTGSKTGDIQLASSEVNNIKAFPNPYYGTSELEYDSGGEKFIYFSHLPAQCKINIYSLNGSLVKSIDRNNSDPTSSLEKWDLKNSSGSKVASGMYIVYIDCFAAGVKILKIAVFTI